MRYFRQYAGTFRYSWIVDLIDYTNYLPHQTIGGRETTHAAACFFFLLKDIRPGSPDSAKPDRLQPAESAVPAASASLPLLPPSWRSACAANPESWQDAPYMQRAPAGKHSHEHTPVQRSSFEGFVLSFSAGAESGVIICSLTHLYSIQIIH